MSGKIISILLCYIFLLSAGTISAQEVNQKIIDENSGKPMLIGYCTRDAFQDTSFSWWFKSAYDNYSLNKDTLEFLADKISNYDILIVMGTWCSDSRYEVPRFYKILDSTGYDSSKLQLISVGRKMKDITGKVDELKIEFVPTFIFFQNGEEKGRIVEAPEVSLEGDIRQILNEPVPAN